MENPQPIGPSQDQFTTAQPGPAPWNPNRIVAYVFMVSAIGVGIVLGLNWKRLGKAEWQTETILLSILVPSAAVILAMYWITSFVTIRETPIQLVMCVPFLAMGINLGFAWALARLQNGAYKAYQSGGWEALAAYEYDVPRAILFGVVAAILIAVAATIFGSLVYRG